MNVLVVDDSNTNRFLLCGMLRKIGHHAIEAADGSSALKACEQSLPDMVLMDVTMPDMSGFDVVRQMRQRFDTWVPIIFISAHVNNKEVLEGLKAGGDDYLFKPVNHEILQAKIQIFQDRLRQSRRLLDYRERIEDEADTAREFIRQFTAMDKIDDPLVRFFFRAAEDFSGDLIAVARKPDNSLHVLLADSAGHGLTAALAVIPITQPFYQMTAKGFDIPAIVREINRRVRDYLPLPRFVAAAMLSLNPENGTIQVWNGGCPSVLLLSPEGERILHHFISRHLPLGVVAPADFDAGLEYYALAGEEGQLLLCSDGATEISMGNGLSLDHDGLLSGAAQSTAGHLFERMVETIEGRLNGLPPADDIALIMVGCPPRRPELPGAKLPLVTQHNAELRQGQCGYGKAGESVWQFSLTLTAQQLKRLDVVPFLLGIAGQIEGGKTDGKLFLVLSELFNNALDHGILKLDSALKNLPDGMELYFSERAARLAELEQGQIVMHLERLSCVPCGCLKIYIRDSGDGFDYAVAQQADLEHNRQRYGRGVALLSSMCSALKYVGNGSEVTAYVALTKP